MIKDVVVYRAIYNDFRHKMIDLKERYKGDSAGIYINLLSNACIDHILSLCLELCSSCMGELFEI